METAAAASILDPKERASYAMRDPARTIREAHEVGQHVGGFMAQLHRSQRLCSIAAS